MLKNPSEYYQLFLKELRHFLKYIVTLEMISICIQVYDGSDSSAPLLGTFCGDDDVEDIISTSSTVFILFHTDDSSQTREGFSITYIPYSNYTDFQ